MIDQIKDVTRRDILKLGGYATLGSLLVPANPTQAVAAAFDRGLIKDGARELSFRFTHTGETFSGVYRVGNKYLPDAFDKINMVLRDHRTKDVFPIDPRLMDIIYVLQQMSGSDRPYDVISGYRSPKSNTMLRNASSGVAKKSYHMTGQAIDIRIPEFSTKALRAKAVSLKAGGVGYYRKSDFLHVDTGVVRDW